MDNNNNMMIMDIDEDEDPNLFYAHQVLINNQNAAPWWGIDEHDMMEENAHYWLAGGSIEVEAHEDNVETILINAVTEAVTETQIDEVVDLLYRDWMQRLTDDLIDNMAMETILGSFVDEVVQEFQWEVTICFEELNTILQEIAVEAYKEVEAAHFDDNISCMLGSDFGDFNQVEYLLRI